MEQHRSHAAQAASDPEDPAYDWTWLDERVAAIGRAGLRPLLVLYAAPAWAQEEERGRRLLAPVPGDFAAFAAAAARRYDGTDALRQRVRYWQIWNEPNYPTFFTSVDGRRRYRVLVNAAYSRIHAVASDNVVVAGGLSPFATEAGDAPLAFMRGMLCMSRHVPPRPTCAARSSFDVWAHHPYTSGGPTHSALSPEDVSMGDLPEMRRLLRAAERAHHIRPRGRTPFWVTEFSWDTNPPDPRGVNVKLHGRWVAEALYRMWRNGVTLAVWFELRDIPSTRDWGVFGQGGLFYRTGDLYAGERAKPAARAFRFPFVALPGRRAVTVWGRTPDSEAHVVTIERRTQGGWTRVARVRATRHGIFRLRPPGLNGRVLRARVGSATSLPFRAVPTPDVPVEAFGSGRRPR